MISLTNAVIYDNAGIPSFMVRFKKEKNSDLFPGGSDATHPAFMIGGEEYNEIYLPKYAATIFNGRAYSWPGQRPATNITYEEAMKACFDKGPGWHMMTAAEYGLAILDSKRKRTLPHGNTNCGRDYYHPEEQGVVFDSVFTYTGSGPETWAHDHTREGIHDLSGNIWEMMAGLRLMNGGVQVIRDNNAAAPHDCGPKSEAWEPVTHDGQPVKFAIKDGVVVLTTGEIEKDWDGCRWEDVRAEIEVPELIKALSLFQIDDQDGKSFLFVDTNAERLPSRGGNFSNTSNAGLGYCYLSYPRSRSYVFIGFRAAYYRKTDN